MNRTIYALLVGIDRYPAGIPSLRGCVNDIARIHRFLRERSAADDTTFEALLLNNEDATRQAIIDGFRLHLSRAGANDAVLFYYSGHGSQARTPPELLHLEPDGLDETLVCYDSRTPTSWDLADKELACLIAELAANGPQITVILDCCHSGTGTRAPAAQTATVRRAPTDERQRPLHTFLVTPQQATAFALPAARGEAYASGWFALPGGRHVVLSACRADETAKELNLHGEQRGIFSYYLLETLQQAGASLSNRDLFKRTNALVRAGVAQQSPQIEATDIADLDQPFLGGSGGGIRGAYTASYNRAQGWVIDGGAVHGIPEPAGDETSVLALFPFDADVTNLSTMAGALGTARVTHVFASQSAIDINLHSGAAPDPATTYKAVLTALPLPPLLVALSGESAALAMVRAAMARAAPNGGPSLLLREGAAHEAAYTLQATDQRYRIQRNGDAYALVVDTPGFTEQSAMLAVQRLEHIARWQQILTLANPASQLAPDAVRLEIMLRDRQGEWRIAPPGNELQLEYALQQGQWQQPQFKIRLVNCSQRRLFCMLLALPETYGVAPLLPGGGSWLDPGATYWLNQNQPFYASIPPIFRQAGATRFKDALKLIVATEECDATLLAQPDLPPTLIEHRAAEQRTVAPAPPNTLSRLMQRVPQRTLCTVPESAEAFVDWNTSEISFTTLRPQDAAELGSAGTTLDLGHNVHVAGHSRLKARLRLSDLPAVGRDAGNLALPALLRDHPEAFEPFLFSASRAGEPGLSVLELLDVNDHSVVSPAAPLLLRIDQPLAAGELLLPLGYDGEFYLPLGRVRQDERGVDVCLERLPAPTSSGARDLQGSIKILFQKLVGQRLNWPYEHPLLALASLDDAGTVHYNTNPATLRAAVQSAEHVLLYIHGIIDDTRNMVASAYPQRLGLDAAVPALAQRYDAILTFDYENLHTTIEENARLLKQRLVAAGLGPDYAGHLDIAAYSMGGLVARWLIEREGGDRMVSRLVMLGTPNAGSPWPAVADYANVALGIGLNMLSTIIWPVGVIGLLVSALEYVDVALDQMRPNSTFLKNLAASADPGLPYTIIAGNAALLPHALAADGSQTSPLERLLRRLAPQQLWQQLSAAAFFGQANDTIVSVASSSSIPPTRVPAPRLCEVASDHLSYFHNPASLTALAEALQELIGER